MSRDGQQNGNMEKLEEPFLMHDRT